MNNNAKVLESFRKIQTDQYELPRFIVSQMLPTGVHLFAGSPKIGKSWLVLWLCDKVAKGEKVWELDTQQCAVLYIALEDTKSTLHFRIENITEKASDKLKQRDVVPKDKWIVVENTHEPIIDEVTWARVQGLLLQNKSNSKARTVKSENNKLPALFAGRGSMNAQRCRQRPCTPV